MPRSIRRAIVVVVAALLALSLTTTALASPTAVIDDYLDNGVIDQRYTARDLRQALALARDLDEPLYGQLAEEIGAAYEQVLLGRREQPSEPFAPSTPDVGVSPPASLPAPPPASPVGQPPLVLLLMTALAGLLAVAGVVSAVARRLRQR